MQALKRQAAKATKDEQYTIVDEGGNLLYTVIFGPWRRFQVRADVMTPKPDVMKLDAAATSKPDLMELAAPLPPELRVMIYEYTIAAQKHDRRHKKLKRCLMRCCSCRFVKGSKGQQK